MKQSSVPFWWVVRSERGYYDTDLGWFPRQAHAEPFMSRGAAENAEANLPLFSAKSARVVRVHARIPDPKLPAWVTPIAFQYRHVQVWRAVPGGFGQYVFRVAGCECGCIRLTETIGHSPDGVRRPQTPADVPPDVWAEAAARAAKMLRAMKKAGQK